MGCDLLGGGDSLGLGCQGFDRRLDRRFARKAFSRSGLSSHEWIERPV